MSKEPPKQAQEKTESFKEAWNRGIQEANKQEQERREKEGRYRPLNWKEGAIILIIWWRVMGLGFLARRWRFSLKTFLTAGPASAFQGARPGDAPGLTTSGAGDKAYR